MEEIIPASLYEAAGDIHPPSTCEAKVLQMFIDMKEDNLLIVFDCKWRNLTN